MITKEQAEEFLKKLGEEELLFSHHMTVMARPAAYERLASLINEQLMTAKDWSGPHAR